jgi:hypothetical protein
MKNFLLIMSVCVVGFVSCKKDDSPSNTDLLVQSSWKINNIGADVTGDGKVDQDITSQVPACIVDNTFTFKKDGTGVVDEGATKCDPSSPSSYPFAWTLQGSTLNANIPGLLNGNIELHSVTSTSMELWKDSTFASVPAKIIVTLKH